MHIDAWEFEALWFLLRLIRDAEKMWRSSLPNIGGLVQRNSAYQPQRGSIAEKDFFLGFGTPQRRSWLHEEAPPEWLRDIDLQACFGPKAFASGRLLK